jgi:hypothetical protein
LNLGLPLCLAQAHDPTSPEHPVPKLMMTENVIFQPCWSRRFLRAML